jgi:hypothetical protein
MSDCDARQPLMQERWTELHDCLEFIQTLIESGEGHLSPEEAVRLWREDWEDHLQKLGEAIESFKAGEPGKPHEQFMQEIRERFGLK